jgi:two-component system C4-dicarboxylate transport sensor histidine kinase DctB
VSTEELSPRAVEALLEAERHALVGRLLKGTVHNLSGALQTIRLPLDLVEMQAARGGGLELGPKLDSLQQGVSRLGRELDLLAARSQEAGRRQAERLDAAGLVRGCLEFWPAHMYFKHEISLSLAADGPAPAVAAPVDAALAFNALVRNAVEALEAAGQAGLSVEVAAAKGRTRILVRDQAGGPSAAMAPEMFEPFATDKPAPHQGLGLFLARRAVAPWGGGVEWLGPETGFALSLPQP